MEYKFTLLQSNIPTVNGRIYPEHIIKNMFEIINKGGITGITVSDKIGYEKYYSEKNGIIIPIKDISHFVKDPELVYEDNNVRLDVKVVPVENPDGDLLLLLFNDSDFLELFYTLIIPRGTGHVDENNIIKDDYVLEGIDVWVRKKNESKVDSHM